MAERSAERGGKVKAVIHPEVYRNFNHSRAKAIATHCLECSGDSFAERSKCSAKGCALWAFRSGYEVEENGNRIIKRPVLHNKAVFCAENGSNDEDEGLPVGITENPSKVISPQLFSDNSEPSTE